MKILVEDNADVLKDWSELCLKAKLFVPGRMAEEWFEKPDGMVKMSLLDHKSVPIGWSMLYRDWKEHWFWGSQPVLGVFVSPKFRRMGLATKLVNSIMKNVDFPIYVDRGIKLFNKLPILSKEKINALANGV